MFPKSLVPLTLTIFLFPLANQPGSIHASHNPRLVISEVHPSVNNDGSSWESHEWIEIHNLERHPVNLDGWIIEDAQSIAPLPDIELPAGGAVLIAGSAADIEVPAGKTLIILDRPRIGTGLRNAGDRVALINPYGVRYDAVSWGDVRWPRASEPPNPRQSIVRTSTGGQSLSDRLTPWTVGEAISAEPDRHRHSRPDTSVRLVNALVDPGEGDSETLTIRNSSDRPLFTVNWTLTVNNSLITLPSVRIEPGESYDIHEADGTLGAGMSRDGGHLVLRDSRGNWLATASWGDDHTFHRIPPPDPGQELRFNPFARVHPRVPWFDFDRDDRLMVNRGRETRSLLASSTSSRALRELHHASPEQDTDRAPIWVSEVYPNAGQGRSDAAYEWFELTISSDSPLRLDGWSIADNPSADSLDGVTIPPGASVVIAATAQAGSGVATTIEDGRIGNGLANSGDQLRLINPAGEVVSAFSWGDDRSFDAVKALQPDESLHRESPSDIPFLARPSPGMLTLSPTPTPTPTNDETRSVPPGQDSLNDSTQPAQAEPAIAPVVAEALLVLIITEILPAPLPGQPEWVEIHNPNEESVNLSGWTIGDPQRRTALSGTVTAGSYVVVTTQPLESDVDTIVVGRIGNGLNNDADIVAIFTPNGRVVHEVSYGHGDLPAPDRGLSIALEPERWVVTALPTPGAGDVTPLLADAFGAAAPKSPMSDEDRLPLVSAEEDAGVNAWMIVSFALIGVIFTLVVRRVQPDQAPPAVTVEASNYSGPDTDSAAPLDAEDHNEPTRT